MEEMEPIEEESEPELVEKPKEKPKVDVDLGEEYCIKGDRAYYGYGVPQSYCEALKHYNNAAKEGCARAYGCIGRMYESGIYVEQDLKQAFEFYKKGADLRDSTSLFALGKYYEKDIVPDHIELRGISIAVECYIQAKDLNNHEAITRLGYMHEHVIYFEQHNEIALMFSTEERRVGKGFRCGV